MKIMFNFKLRAIIVLGVLMPKVYGTSDVTLSMYMYLANHLTPQECLEFTARLYGEGLEPMAVKELEQELLSMNEPCLSLITTWNDSDGKEKNFLNVANSLKKIGNQKLAEWLSDTVFTKLSMDLNECFLQSTTTVTAANDDLSPTGRQLNIQPEEVKTESCSANQSFISLLLDTIFTYFVLMAIVTLVLYSLEVLINCFIKEGQNILMTPKMEYTILEIGNLPADLSFNDKILDPLLS